VRDVAERARITENRFHARFGSKEACFARAYSEAAESLPRRLLEAVATPAAGATPSARAWRELLRFVAEQPLTAKALLLEVRAARGDAWARHQRQSSACTAALDTARDEPGAVPGQPDDRRFHRRRDRGIARDRDRRRRGDRVENLLGDLTRLAFLQFFGEEREFGGGIYAPGMDRVDSCAELPRRTSRRAGTWSSG
jgi:AcrR family transcriptional regulator